MKKVLHLFLIITVLASTVIPAFAAAVTEDELADLKEEINSSIADLNSRIDGVKTNSEKGATVGGQFFFSYTQDSKAAASYPSFNMDRCYLDFKKTLDRDSSIRVTTDINYESTLSNKWNVFLKNAYYDLGGFTVPIIGLNDIRLGQSGTYWIDYMQGFWTYRYLAKVMEDDQGLVSSTDLGFAGLGFFKLPFLGPVNYQATIMNGGGYKASQETNFGKDYAIRFDASPWVWDADNKVTTAIGFISKDVNGDLTADTLTKYTNFMLGWNFNVPAKGILFGEMLWGNPRKQGFSFGGQYEFFPGFNIFGKNDNYDPDTNIGASNDKTYTVLGLEYLWGTNIRIALDNQVKTTGGNQTNNIYGIHTEVKW